MGSKLTTGKTLCECGDARSLHFHHKDFGFTVCQADGCGCRKFVAAEPDIDNPDVGMVTE